jgi:predicted nucleic acid-binding Zn ribbon protein
MVSNCRLCNKQFDRRSDALFCSRVCKYTFQNRKRVAQQRKNAGVVNGNKRCLVCGELFPALRSDRKYCSQRCKLRASPPRQRPRIPPRRFVCTCGREFFGRPRASSAVRSARTLVPLRRGVRVAIIGTARVPHTMSATCLATRDCQLKAVEYHSC